jgi:pentatricopeptide repeat protein
MREMFEEMKREGVEPDETTYNILIKNYMKQENHGAYFQLRRDMENEYAFLLEKKKNLSRFKEIVTPKTEDLEFWQDMFNC